VSDVVPGSITEGNAISNTTNAARNIALESRETTAYILNSVDRDALPRPCPGVPADFETGCLFLATKLPTSAFPFNSLVNQTK